MGLALQKVERFFAAFNAKDAAGCREVIEEAERAGLDYRSPMGTLSTADEIMDGVVALFWEAFPDGVVETVSTADTGDVVTLEHRFSGTHTGPLATPDGNAVPPTGRTIAFDACTVVRAEHGTIRSWHAYFDQMVMLTQLGLIPAPAMT